MIIRSHVAEAKLVAFVLLLDTEELAKLEEKALKKSTVVLEK